MATNHILVRIVILMLGVLALPVALAAACESSVGCVYCIEGSGGSAECGFSEANGRCSCKITVDHPGWCTVSGNCTYTPPGGGGSGGGGGGGGSNDCIQGPGEWCPAECFNCGFVFWPTVTRQGDDGSQVVERTETGAREDDPETADPVESETHPEES